MITVRIGVDRLRGHRRIGVLLVALVSGRDGCAFRERRLRWIKNNKRLVAPNCRVPRCTYVFEMGVTATL
jgi:hypothetical protein